MKIAILYDIVRWEEKALLEAGKKRGLEIELVDVRGQMFDLSSHKGAYGDVALQRATSYYRGLHAAAIIQSYGTPVVNSMEILEITGNKAFTLLKLREHGVPIPHTYVTFDVEKALESFKSLGGRAVIKPVMGSWGRMVGLLETENSAKAVLEDRLYMDPLYQVYYMQEYVRRPPRDIRAFVVGKRVIAAIYRYQPETDWRTNTALGGRAENCPVTGEIEDLALRAATAIGDGIYGVDIMENENGMVVHEVNGTVEFKNSVPVTGVDIHGKIVEYLIDTVREK
ncbi:MAG: lysine biosynthesis protein LysX [Conexivisphaerales archaeon]